MFVSSEPSYFASFSTGLETFSQLLYEDEYGAVRISFDGLFFLPGMKGRNLVTRLQNKLQ